MRRPPAIAASLWALAHAGCAARTGRPAEASEAVACPHDAIAGGGTCRCGPGLFILEGACAGPRELDAYCGTPASGAGSCRAPVCAEGDAIDLATGACAPAQTARRIVAQIRPVPNDLKLACREGHSLVVRGDSVTCVPSSDVCPRGSEWDPATARCLAIPPCAPGEVRRIRSAGADAGAGECLRVVTRSRGGVPVVDVGRWLGAMLGADGGEATARVCRPLGQQVGELEVGPGGARTLSLAVELIFPDNDVTQLSGRVVTVDAASGQAIFGEGAQAVQRAVDALLVPLRALGGASDAASATLNVRCTVHGGGSPSFVPR
jgi:hypothetical protein